MSSFSFFSRESGGRNRFRGTPFDDTSRTRRDLRARFWAGRERTAVCCLSDIVQSAAKLKKKYCTFCCKVEKNIVQSAVKLTKSIVQFVVKTGVVCALIHDRKKFHGRGTPLLLVKNDAELLNMKTTCTSDK